MKIKDVQREMGTYPQAVDSPALPSPLQLPRRKSRSLSSADVTPGENAAVLDISALVEALRAERRYVQEFGIILT
jgi:hypothetical protein